VVSGNWIWGLHAQIQCPTPTLELCLADGTRRCPGSAQVLDGGEPGVVTTARDSRLEIAHVNKKCFMLPNVAAYSALVVSYL
jgi:hypothetical protein